MVPVLPVKERVRERGVQKERETERGRQRERVGEGLGCRTCFTEGDGKSRMKYRRGTHRRRQFYILAIG
eukprot:12884924-Prorocentrum_lima.AAC.1